MIKSKYISDILDLLLDGDDVGKSARPQIAFLTDANYNYTGVGLFVTFKHAHGIEQYRVSTEKNMINGVEIRSNELDIAAEAMASLNNGLIVYLEIWSYSGKYPTEELTNYTLTQSWNGSTGREIRVERSAK